METHYALDEKNNIINAVKGLGKRAKIQRNHFICGGCGKAVRPYTEGNFGESG